MSSGVEVDLRELSLELKKIDRRTLDFSPITPVLAEILVSYVNDRWDSAGNGEWKGLAESTKRKRRKRGLGAQILKDTGRAAASVRADSDASSASAVTDTAYMVFHVSSAPRTVIPLRDPFDVLEQAAPELEDTIADWVASGES